MSDPNSDSDLAGDNSNYLIIKGTVKAIQTKINSLFIIVMNEEKRVIENVSAVASRFSVISDISPGVPWYIFDENLNNLKLKGDVSAHITADLRTTLAQSLEKDRGNELLTYLKHNDHTKVNSLIQSIFLKPLSDKNMIVEVAAENISKQDYDKIIKDRKEPKEKKLPQEQKRTVKGDIVDIDLVLAPVSGIPIYKLKEGDRIMVRIVDNSEKASYHIESYGLRIDENIIPLKAEVLQVKKNPQNEYMILCKLKDGVFGKTIETERVKLKTYEEIVTTRSDVDDVKQQGAHEKEVSFPLIAIITGGLVFLILVALIVLWFLDVI
ncbi:MAG TPA: DUF4899 domain-containing protein [Spirochaetes bacterium]|nr:DUF4899 domain-containing protein [Spirochaetota bacterium]